MFDEQGVPHGQQDETKSVCRGSWTWHWSCVRTGHRSDLRSSNPTTKPSFSGARGVAGLRNAALFEPPPTVLPDAQVRGRIALDARDGEGLARSRCLEAHRHAKSGRTHNNTRRLVLWLAGDDKYGLMSSWYPNQVKNDKATVADEAQLRAV
ncbi:hypothetical protein N657DRAFT_401633 [Parathielavia appendiculata]|uniref:Uncharacterized protein n=1 Tax=Parathielavia appendiculata TaxID=2587402 RepID=A0AAN6U1L5_9PEZI|nr:hypothetical protein N657DRAFT_401633 [Parathielavia appendiculata]